MMPLLPPWTFRRFPLGRGLAACLALLAAHPARAQSVLDQDPGDTLDRVGWTGFTDLAFMGQALGVLALATLLGAVIAYHPRSRGKVDTVEESEAPKTYLTYAVVGAVIGLMVVEYGMVVGFVVFGIGGLFRFRTTLSSAAGTGRLILVTLVGLSCGLDLPHLGVLATVFGFALIFWLDRKVTCLVEVKDLDNEHLVESALAYRALIERQGGRVIRERRRFSKRKVTFIFQARYAFGREAMERAFDEQIPADLQGSADWEVE